MLLINFTGLNPLQAISTLKSAEQVNTYSTCSFIFVYCWLYVSFLTFTHWGSLSLLRRFEGQTLDFLFKLIVLLSLLSVIYFKATISHLKGDHDNAFVYVLGHLSGGLTLQTEASDLIWRISGTVKCWDRHWVTSSFLCYLWSGSRCIHAVISVYFPCVQFACIVSLTRLLQEVITPQSS